MNGDIGDFSVHPARRWKRFLFKSPWLYRALGLVFFYGAWVLCIRFLSLTLITYFTMSPTTRFQDISDVFNSNEVSIMGIASLFFIAVLHQLYPFVSTSFNEIVTREKIEKQFLPGFIQGAIFAGITVLVFLFSGVYRYLGYFIQFSEAPIELANTLFRMISLGIFAYFEEYLFHDKILKSFQKELPTWISAHFIALLSCGIKALQFDLNSMHLVTLYLISLSLYYRSTKEGTFAKGAGFLAAVFIVFQPLVSLPIFGNDFSGILLIKYQGQTLLPALTPVTNWETLLSTPGIIPQFLTGGSNGPLCSFIFQLILILDIGRSMSRTRL